MKELGHFATWMQWVNSARGRTYPVNVVFFDAKGRRCLRGADFTRARDEDAFPVRYFDPAPDAEEAPA